MLRGMGAMLALPQLEIMAQTANAGNITAAGSSGGVAPMRFISVFMPNGVFPQDWDVKGEGTNYKMSPILEPLEPLREEVSILSGLDNDARGGHVAMTSAFLTGTNLKGGTAGESLDQRIGRHIGNSTRFKSMVLGTEPPRQGKAGRHAISIASTVTWSSATTRVSPEINPQIAFDRMFRTKTGAEAVKDAKYRKSVIDLVLEDAKSLQRKASYIDKQKLEEYLESVRAVETQLEKTLNPVEADWTPPTKPSESDIVRPNAGIPRTKDEHLKLMTDLIVLGMWTDSTRVATLMTAHGFSRQNFSFLDGVSGDHHSISHHKGIKDKTSQYSKVSRWYVEQFVYLMNRLKAIDEGGSNILDNSVILFGSSMKDGNGHKRNNLPLVLGGKGQGKLNPGSHIKLKNQPLKNLHYTIGEKFGVAEEMSGSLIQEI